MAGGHVNGLIVRYAQPTPYGYQAIHQVYPGQAIVSLSIAGLTLQVDDILV
jgi:hypothetical protein